MDVLKKVEGLSFVYFDQGDVVRHHLVQRIIQAYDEHKARIEEQLSLLENKASANGKSNGTDASIAEKNENSPAENRVAE